MCGWVSMQEVQPHQPEAVAVLGQTVQPTCLSPGITLDDLIASLRLEQGEVAAAVVKVRDSLQEQARLQHDNEAKQAAAAAALLAAEKAKPKARPPPCCVHLLLGALWPSFGVPPWFCQPVLQCVYMQGSQIWASWS